MAMTPSENASTRDGPMTCSLMAEFVAENWRIANGE
jgi:hypothetical protein